MGSDDFLYAIPNNGVLRVIRQHVGWINGMLEDEKGAIWVADATALMVYKDGRLSKFSRNLYNSRALEEDRGHLWVGALNGLFLMERPNPFLRPVAPQTIQGEVNAVLKDHDGNLWVGTTAAGLIRLTAGVTSSFTAADRLSDDKILSLYEDPEGSLWVGTAAGLDRFRKTKLTTFTRKEGLPADQTSLAGSSRRCPATGCRPGSPACHCHTNRASRLWP